VTTSCFIQFTTPLSKALPPVPVPNVRVVLNRLIQGHLRDIVHVCKRLIAFELSKPDDDPGPLTEARKEWAEPLSALLEEGDVGRFGAGSSQEALPCRNMEATSSWSATTPPSVSTQGSAHGASPR